MQLDLSEDQQSLMQALESVIGRSGEVVGIYDKLSPVTTTPDYTSFEDGITPGDEPCVFDAPHRFDGAIGGKFR